MRKKKVSSFFCKNENCRFAKNILFLVILIGIILISLIHLVSATDIFYDNFESGSLSEWNLSHLGTGADWTSSTTNPYQGTRHAESRPTYTTQPASVTQKKISTSGYENIVFKYYKRSIGLDAADEFQVEWYDGTGWSILEQTGSSSSNDAAYVSRSYSLPAGANNNPSFTIKFECTAGATSEYCRIDNVNVSGDVIFDDSYPVFSNFLNNPGNNSAYINGAVYRFNTTIVNTNGTAGIEFNSVNYSTTNSSNNFTVSINNLGAGTYNYYWFGYGNGTNHLFNKTNIFYYTVNKGVLIGNLTNTGSWTVTYPMQTNISYIETNLGDSDIKYNISRDNVYKNSGENITLPPGTYIYVLNSTGGMNYSANASIDTKILTVNKNTSTQTSLIFDKTSPQSYSNSITPTCSILTGQGSPTLALNGITITSGNPIILGAGTWTFNCSIADNGNYTQASNSSQFQITQNNTYVLNLSANPSWIISYGTQINITGLDCPSQLTCNLYRNDTGIVSNGVNVTLGAGSYNYTIIQQEIQIIL